MSSVSPDASAKVKRLSCIQIPTAHVKFMFITVMDDFSKITSKLKLSGNMLCLPGCPISKPDHQTHVQFHSYTNHQKTRHQGCCQALGYDMMQNHQPQKNWWIQMQNSNNFACPSWSIGAQMPWTKAVWRFGKLHDPPAKVTRSQGSRQKRASHLSAAAWSPAGLWARPGGEEDDGPNGSMGQWVKLTLWLVGIIWIDMV